MVYDIQQPNQCAYTGAYGVYNVCEWRWCGAGAGLCSKQEDGFAMQAQGSAASTTTCKGTSQALLEAGLALAPQDSMCQPAIPRLLVDQGVAAFPRPLLVGERDGLPPPRARLHAMTGAKCTALSSGLPMSADNDTIRHGNVTKTLYMCTWIECRRRALHVFRI